MNGAEIKYLETQINTASPEELTLKIFDGLIMFSTHALNRMREDVTDIQGIHDHLRRAQRACALLMGSLDFAIGGKLAEDLFRIYYFWHHELVMCNMQRMPERLEKILVDFKDYRVTWAQAIKQYRAEKTVVEEPIRSYAGIA